MDKNKQIKKISNKNSKIIIKYLYIIIIPGILIIAHINRRKKYKSKIIKYLIISNWKNQQKG